MFPVREIENRPGKARPPSATMCTDSPGEKLAAFRQTSGYQGSTLGLSGIA
jgi:hypothetical protein